jgi:hypothetical protein
MEITLVACGSKKLQQPAPARDLYIGGIFAMRRRYAERLGRPWFILFAKYGLVDPSQILEPYDQTIRDMTPRAVAL